LSFLLFLDVIDYQSEYGETLSCFDWQSLSISPDCVLSLSKVEDYLITQGVLISSYHSYCAMLMRQLDLLCLQF
jgi:hypothetical protein